MLYFYKIPEKRLDILIKAKFRFKKMKSGSKSDFIEEK